MSLRLYVTIRDDKPPDVSARMWRRWNTEAMGEAGYYFEDHHKMRHFEAGAAARYRHQPRSTKYVEKKARMVDGNSKYISPDAKNDLIYKGALRREVKRPHIPRAYPTRVTITLSTLAYANMTPRGSRPNLGDEATRATLDEIGDIERVLLLAIEERYNNFSSPKTETIT